MSKDFTIVPQDYIVHHIKTDDMLVHTKDGDYAYHVKTERIPLIRCRECKYCSKDRIKWSVKDEDGNWIDTKCNLCRRTKLEVNLDDFCSFGERKDNGKDIQSATE